RKRAAQDLGGARQRAEAAEAARAAAEAAVRIRNDVLSAVAHDLRWPLTGIMGHADLLQRRLERTEPPTQDWIRTHVGALGTGARRMASMVEEIMDVVHLQMGQRLALQVAPVDLGALVEGMARSLEASAGRRAALDVDVSPDLVVEGDRARLERVVQNLLGNAVKYSPEATPVRITVRPQEEEE